MAAETKMTATAPRLAQSSLTDRVAWLLNFDSDRELASPGYTPSSKLTARLRRMVASPAAWPIGLVRPGDIVIGHPEQRALGGLQGRAWCPTPRALAALAAAGARVPVAPPLEVLRRVNGRAFCAELGQTLAGGRWVQDERALREALDSRVSARWCLKQPHSTSGSGKRLVATSALSSVDAAWVARAFGRGGLQVEPWVAREADFALHGFVAPSGEITLGDPCTQMCTATGRWLSSQLAPPRALDADERSALIAETQRAAEALRAAGYFGPFNVDAFRYRQRNASAFNPRAIASDCPAFNPRCEINARYSMGWAIGMRDRRPDLAVLQELG